MKEDGTSFQTKGLNVDEKINIFAFDILCAEKCAQTEVLVYTHRQ